MKKSKKKIRICNIFSGIILGYSSIAFILVDYVGKLQLLVKENLKGRVSLNFFILS